MSLTDNPGGGHAIMPDELAQEIQNAGLDCIVHFTCKDITRNGAISRGYALERMGLRNILALTGDYPKEGYWGLSKPVLRPRRGHAAQAAARHERGPGRRRPGKGTTAPPCDFFVGACVSPFKFTEAEQMTQYYKLHRKLDAGARFIISQLGYDMRKVQELKQYVDLHGIDDADHRQRLRPQRRRRPDDEQEPGARRRRARLAAAPLRDVPQGQGGPAALPGARREDVRHRQGARLPGRAPRRLRAEGRRGEGGHRARRRVAAVLAGAPAGDGLPHRAEGAAVLLLRDRPRDGPQRHDARRPQEAAESQGQRATPVPRDERPPRRLLPAATRPASGSRSAPATSPTAIDC